MINAVICEFNPFHNGHKYLLEKAAQTTGAEATVCIMSGNFVQRGEPAISDKHSRAAIALMHGADLVLQIPTAHSLASAELFARSGVIIADALGVETTLCFGLESEDMTPLLNLAKAPKDELAKHFSKHIKSGDSYALAAWKAYSELTGENADILRSPNNLLAFEYIKAVQDIKSDMHLQSITRVGTEHDSESPSGSFASASFIRNQESAEKYVPTVTLRRLDREKYSAHLLFSLYTKTADELSGFADMSEGLENRFVKAAGSAKTFDELINAVKTKRYTRAKLCRAAVNAFLEVPKPIARSAPPFIKVLGFNDKGRALLKTLANTSKLPIIIKPTDAKGVAPEHFELECRASDIYDYITVNPKGAGTEYKMSPIYKKGL